MADRFLNLFKVFRAIKRRGSRVAPAPQEPEESEPFQPMQDGAAMELTQEQKPTRGRFRRTLKMFRKFVPVRRRKPSSTATESTAEPDSRLTELQAEPDVSPDLAEHSDDSNTAMNDDRAKADMEVTEDVAMTNADTGDTWGITNTDTTPTVIHAPTTDFFEKSVGSSELQVSSLGPGLVPSQDHVIMHPLKEWPLCLLSL
ncbi:uncharacterized protein M8220_016940 [Acridotheres tristis]